VVSLLYKKKKNPIRHKRTVHLKTKLNYVSWYDTILFAKYTVCNFWTNRNVHTAMPSLLVGAFFRISAWRLSSMTNVFYLTLSYQFCKTIEPGDTYCNYIYQSNNQSANLTIKPTNHRLLDYALYNLKISNGQLQNIIFSVTATCAGIETGNNNFPPRAPAENFPGGGGVTKKIAKKGRKIALLSLYLLYLYHVWKSRGATASLPPAADTHAFYIKKIILGAIIVLIYCLDEPIALNGLRPSPLIECKLFVIQFHLYWYLRFLFFAWYPRPSKPAMLFGAMSFNC